MSTKPGVGVGQPQLGVELAQLAQRAGAEAGEHRDPVDLEQRMPAREQRRRIDDEVQRHVGPDQLGAADLVVARRLVDDDRGARAGRPPRPARGGAAARRPRRIGLDRDPRRRADRRRAAARRRRPGPATSRRSGAGVARIGPSRSTRRRATSPCSQGGAAARRRRASAAPAAMPSTSRPVPRSIVAMARQYIEPMLATRRSNAWADPAAALALRMPGLCAVCHGWGRGRVCADCRAAFAAPVPRCRRCALVVAAGIDVCGQCLTAPPAFDAALAAVDYAAPWDRLVDGVQVSRRARPRAAVRRSGRRRQRAPRRSSPRSRRCPFRSRRRGCASAATTRPGSWRDGSRAGSRVSAEPQLLLRIRETAHQLALAAGGARRQCARRVRGRAAAPRRDRGPPHRRRRRRDDHRQHRRRAARRC